MYLYDSNNIKEFIETYIDEADIFGYYLDISSFDVYWCLQDSNRKIFNPLRTDNDPSLSFKMINDKVRMKDWARPEYNGDIYEIVGRMLKKDCNNKHDFIYICNDIIDNMLNIDTYTIKSKPVRIKKSSTNTNSMSLSNTIIEVSTRQWNIHDSNIWRPIGIPTFKFLITEHTYPIYQAWINDTLVYTYDGTNDVGYAYYIGMFEGIRRYKLYFPNRHKNNKFRTNYGYPIEGLDKLKKDTDILVICKSKKDRLSILSYIYIFSFLKGDLSYSLCNITAEGNRIPRNLATAIDKLYDYKYIFTFFDYDRTGKSSAKFHKDEYGYIPLFTFNKDKKDFTDYVYNNPDNANKLFNDFYNLLNSIQHDKE